MAMLDETEASVLRDIKNAKIQAYKEFAERAKKKAYPFPCAIGVEYAVSIRGIDDTLKDLTENK